jgi:gamma-glutamylcyclotransferase (GGCT)/AIG2-like uncharacterized protein YtfP
MIAVFVYGTLLVGESNHAVVSPYLLNVQPGEIKGRLYDVGPYPALVCSGEDDRSITGEWIEVSEEGLAAMDELESYYGPGHADNEYERTWVRDVSGRREGWVYCWTSPRGLQEIHNSSWRAYRTHREM